MPAMTLLMVKYPLMNKSVQNRLEEIYSRLFKNYGTQRWWPAGSPFEVMVGAILTQSAAWKNVETAIANLKAAGVLSPAALREIDLQRLAVLIRPAVYYNVKARKLKALVQWFMSSCNDDISMMRMKDAGKLRAELLDVWGIGEETADSIVLYAAEKPVFVIDAYTRRIIDHIGLKPDGNRYSDYQALLVRNLPADTVVYNEYHALLVHLGKETCRPKPLCSGCCIKDICKTGSDIL
jgi:endonuclease III related protein